MPSSEVKINITEQHKAIGLKRQLFLLYCKNVHLELQRVGCEAPFTPLSFKWLSWCRAQRSPKCYGRHTKRRMQSPVCFYPLRGMIIHGGP